MRILAIDPGSQCGWSYRDERGNHTSGVWCLKGGRHEGGGMRFVRLRGYLNEIHRTYPIDAVAYEEVASHKGTAASHIYGGVVAVLTEFCEAEGLPYQGVPVGTIKKFATGRGNADKAAMVAAAEAKWPPTKGLQRAKAATVGLYDDNQADAMWIAEYAASILRP